ncbi:MAG: hypothetical protein ABJA86_04730 [Nocardioidaceae bacterium]
MRRSVVVWSVVAGSLVALAGGVVRVVATPSPADVPNADHVIVVGVPGLTWAVVSKSRSPALWTLASGGSSGLLTTRAAVSQTCPWDGWVTLGAGNRAVYPKPALDPAAATDPSAPEETPGCAWQSGDPPLIDGRTSPDVTTANDSRNYGAEVALLGTQLSCTTSVGADAPLAVAAPSARVETANLPAVPAGWRRLVDTCPLTLVAAQPVSASLPGDGAVDELDQILSGVAAATAGQADVVIVVGISEIGVETSRLHVAVMYGRGITPGLLQSASTGRTGFVQLIDVAPTVLAALGQPAPSAMAGQPFGSIADPTSLDHQIHGFSDQDQAAVQHRRLSSQFPFLLVGLELLLCACAFWWLRRDNGSPRWQRRSVRAGSLFVASVPVGTFLANLFPWWRQAHPALALLVLTVAAAAGVLAVVALGPWKRSRYGRVVAVSAITCAVLAGDALTGSHLQLNSLLGYDGIVAGRFTGFGNMPFGVYAAGTLICLAALLAAHPQAAGWVAASFGLAVVGIDGMPGLGSDFGGVIALTPAIILMTMVAARVRLSAGRALTAGLAGVVTVTVLALLDHARPVESQTHLGRFVGQVLDGTAWTVVTRKADSNLQVLTHSSLAMMLPLTALALWWLFRRPGGPGRPLLERSRWLPAVLIGLLVTAVLGSVVNDSGVAVFAAVAIVGLPLLVATLADEVVMPIVEPAKENDSPLGSVHDR